MSFLGHFVVAWVGSFALFAGSFIMTAKFISTSDVALIRSVYAGIFLAVTWVVLVATH